jgi:hypothetical protein
VCCLVPRMGMPEEAESGQRQGNEERPYEDENATMS